MLKGLEPAYGSRKARINRAEKTTLRAQLELYGPQFDFVTSETRFTAFIGGIGSGKTTAGAVKLLLKAGGPKPTLSAVVAPTYPMLRDATFRSFLDLFQPFIKTYNKSDFEVTLKNGSEILFRSADKPDRLRGPNLHSVWIDEAALCPEGTWEIMIGRVRADGKAGDVWLTGTPKGQNWLARKIHLMELHRARTSENPYLNAEFVEALEASYFGKYKEQELGGEFVKFEGLIYEEWEPFYVRSDYDELTEEGVLPRGRFDTIIAGGDAGFTHPAVLLVIGIRPDGSVHVLDEFYRTRQLNAAIGLQAKAFNDLYGIDMLYLDPSAASLRAEIADQGLTVQSADNSIFDGILTVKGMMATGQLTISPRCANLLSELNQYAWKDGSKEEPIKQNDHALDSLRYALHTHFKNSISGQLFY